MDAVADPLSGRPPLPARRVRPTCPFIEFPPEETARSIVARFEWQAALYPERLAVKGKERALSYGELNREANRVAHALLAARGQGAEPIGLLLEHDVQLIVALLGVLKSGKFYVPFDPLYPRARTTAMLDDVQPSLLLVDRDNLALAAELCGDPARAIDIGALAPSISSSNPDLEVGLDDYAYILFTSGSTGLPKGVVESHRNVLHFTRRYTNDCHFSPRDRLPLMVSCCFSGAVAPLYGALLNGASLHLLDLKTEGVSRLADWLLEERLTIFYGTTAFSQLVRSLSGGEQFSQVRLIYCAAEPLYKRDFERYRQHFSDDCILVNGLGTTEKKSLCRYFMDKRSAIEGEIVPIGYPADDTEIFLLDESGSPVEIGQVGEITIKSRYIAPGFWRQPELTHSTFRPDPAGSNKRVWRTGDLGRMRPDGCLEHVGRRDSQVKIRGYRIELGEVEAALLELPYLTEAVVVARDMEADGRRLVAYVVPAAGHDPTVTELRAALGAKLPSYMVPSGFVTLEALPRNPNGKLDRLALPEPDRARPELATDYAPPRTPGEMLLAEIWSEVLGQERVGIHDDFLALGGDSLLATRLISRVRDALQVEFPFTELFRSPTVADQAAALFGHGNTESSNGELARLVDEPEATGR
jgi:amino acid adenylation domain-containing protein